MKELTLGSLFSGSAGFELSGALCGIRPVWSSEIEPFPLRVEAARFPDCKQLGSVMDISGADAEPVDIITFGSPCFPKGTLVLTAYGYLPIEEIRVGMKVLTHTGAWRSVSATGNKYGQTVRLRGNHYGLECTANHPIYTVSEKHDYGTRRNGKRNNRIVITDEKSWVPAEEMLGKLWAVPNYAESLEIDLPNGYEASTELFYFTGRWLGDGWIRGGKRPDRPSDFATVYLCDSKDKADELVNAVSALTDHYSFEECGNTVKIKFHSREICDWLVQNFGKYSYGKTMPGWVFGMKYEYRNALMNGLIDSDGHFYKRKNEIRISTVSKKLAESIRILGEGLGFSTTVFFTKTPETYVIEGRQVSQRDYYTVALHFDNQRPHWTDDRHGWYRVRSVQLANEQGTTVYNLTVDTDNSYIADGIVVHNCQDLSVAGKQAGIHDGERSNLFFEAIRIIKEMRNATANEFPRFAVWENVPGAFSSNKGEDFRAVLDAFCSVCEDGVHVPRPERGGWRPSGCVVGNGYSIAWRVYDAQFWGVPQRRKRIYLIADFGSERAGEILFESQGLSGDHQPGAEERERASRYVAGCPDGGRFFLWGDGC